MAPQIFDKVAQKVSPDDRNTAAGRLFKNAVVRAGISLNNNIRRRSNDLEVNKHLENIIKNEALKEDELNSKSTKISSNIDDDNVNFSDNEADHPVPTMAMLNQKFDNESLKNDKRKNELFPLKPRKIHLSIKSCHSESETSSYEVLSSESELDVKECSYDDSLEETSSSEVSSFDNIVDVLANFKLPGVQIKDMDFIESLPQNSIGNYSMEPSSLRYSSPKLNHPSISSFDSMSLNYISTPKEKSVNPTSYVQPYSNAISPLSIDQHNCSNYTLKFDSYEFKSPNSNDYLHHSLNTPKIDLTKISSDSSTPNKRSFDDFDNFHCENSPENQWERQRRNKSKSLSSLRSVLDEQSSPKQLNSASDLASVRRLSSDENIRKYESSSKATCDTDQSPDIFTESPYLRRKRFRTNLPRYDYYNLLTFKYDDGFIDAHCHLDFLFQRAEYTGTFADYILEHKDTFPDCFKGCVAVFCNPFTFSKKSVWEPFLKEENIWTTFGCHPHNAKDYDEEIDEALIILMKNEKTVALGEIGLDYSNRNNCSKALQHKTFKRQLQLALRYKKPLVIHCRNAHEDCLEIMKKLVPEDYSIHLHCFTDTWDLAQEWLKEFPNLFIGITNVVTFPSAEPVHEVVKNLPLDRLLLETDAPYFVPRVLAKDKRWSHPGMAIHVASQIAALKEISLEEVLKFTRNNTKKMYGI